MEGVGARLGVVTGDARGFGLQRDVQASNEPRRVLVLGAGFIGSALVPALIDRGHSVVAVTRSQPRPEREKLLDQARLVISEHWLKVLPNLLAGADDLIYCVGSASPTQSEVDPARDISAVLPPLVRVLDLLRLHPSTRLTFLSSGGTVYGDLPTMPIPEQAPTEPISSYGLLKLACENYIHLYAKLHDVDARILRVANPYGPTQDASAGQGLVARLFGNAVSGDAVVLFGGGEAIRDYLHVDDLAAAIAGSLAVDQLPSVLNIGSGVGHSSLEVVELVAQVTGADFEIRFDPPRGYDVQANVLDVSAAKGAIGYPTRGLEQGLRDTWAALRRRGATVSKPRSVPLKRADGG